ncbi:MAG: hypothetical protein J6X33_07920 [Clostridiales bacterium]|nr:hypothetical protein [Clostridiales bacterium]
MKSDVIRVTSDGGGVSKAIEQAEAVAAFKGLSKKDALHLRLLAEEALGMLQAISGGCTADFWIEDEKEFTTVHLKSMLGVTSELRDALMSVSTTGKNIAAKGIMGKIREAFERAMEPSDAEAESVVSPDILYPNVDTVSAGVTAGYIWSLTSYRTEVKDAPKEDWDELERSIVANIADEIEVGVREGSAELVIYKKF